MKLKDLAANPKNPRRISERRLAVLKSSLERFGDLSGFVFNRRTKKLISGHQRQKTLSSESEIKITKKHDPPTKTRTVADGYVSIDGEQFKYREVDADETWEAEAMLAANKHGGDWDNDILRQIISGTQNINIEIAGFEIPELEALNISVPEFNSELSAKNDESQRESERLKNEAEDEVPETPKVAKSKRGDLFTLGEHRLLCGDATSKEDVERLMAGEKADLVFTSPPYLELRDYGGHLDLSILHLAKMFDWPSRLFIVNLGLIIRDRKIIPYWDEWLGEAMKRGLPLISWNVWDKGNASSVGHQQAMFGLSHEWIFILGDYRELNRTKPNKGAGGSSWTVASQRKRDGSIEKKEQVQVGQLRQLDTVFQLQGLRNFSEDYVGHPAAFPSEFPSEFIKACTQETAIVGDPFSGSGSTLVACEKTGRRCFGMEIEPLYIDVIIERWEKLTGKKAQLLSQFPHNPQA